MLTMLKNAYQRSRTIAIAVWLAVGDVVVQVIPIALDILASPEVGAAVSAKLPGLSWLIPIISIALGRLRTLDLK